MTLTPSTLVGPFTAAQATKLYNTIDSDLSPIVVATSNAPFGGVVYTTYTTATCKSKHIAAVGCRDIRLQYKMLLAGTVVGTPEVLPSNNVEIKVSIEDSAGTLIPVYFDGARLKLLKVGTLLTSDPIGVTFAKDEVFYVRTFINRISSAAFVDNIGEPGNFSSNQTNMLYSYNARGTTFSNGEGASFSVATGVDPFLTDFTDSGTIAASANVVFAPTAILGIPSEKTAGSVAIIGDSISAGSGDLTAPNTASTSPNPSEWGFGHWVRALGARKVAYSRLAQGGEQALEWITNADVFHRQAMINNTSAIIALGTNDIAGAGATAAQVQTYLTTLVAKIKNYVDRVYVSTILPRATSTDGFVTLANQTSTTSNNFSAIKNEVNDWLRAGNLRVPIIDVADIAESSRNSNKWVVASILDSGTATSGSATTVVDTSKSWATNQWFGYIVTNMTTGQNGYISSNTNNTLTCSFITGQFSPAVGVGDLYRITSSYTGDGTHPCPYGFKQLAAGLPEGLFS